MSWGSLIGGLKQGGQQINQPGLQGNLRNIYNGGAPQTIGSNWGGVDRRNMPDRRSAFNMNPVWAGLRRGSDFQPSNPYQRQPGIAYIGGAAPDDMTNPNYEKNQQEKEWIGKYGSLLAGPGGPFYGKSGNPFLGGVGQGAVPGNQYSAMPFYGRYQNGFSGVGQFTNPWGTQNPSQLDALQRIFSMFGGRV